MEPHHNRISNCLMIPALIQTTRIQVKVVPFVKRWRHNFGEEEICRIRARAELCPEIARKLGGVQVGRQLEKKRKKKKNIEI